MSASQVPRGALVVLVLVVAFAIGVSAENRARYLSLRSTFAQDLGSFNNQAWNIAHGRNISYLSMAAWFAPGAFDGPSVLRSAHFTPLRTTLLPWLYRLRPQIETAMFLQGLLIGIGAFALYGIAVERAQSPACGLLLAASYLLHPAILNTAANDLREITLGIGPGLLACYFHATGRLRAFTVAALVTLAARSEYAVLIAALGFLNFRIAPRRLVSLVLPVALAAGWGVLAEIYYRHYYAVHWPLLAFAGGSSHAALVIRFLGRLVPFLKLMLLPAVLALGTPEAAALAMPFVALAKRVHATEFPPNHLQHLSPAMVAVFWGFAITLSGLWRRPRLRALLAGAVALGALVSFGLFARAAWRAYPRDLAPFEAIGQWADGVPGDATVVVASPLVARFSDHARVLDYENLPVIGAGPAEHREARDAVMSAADLVVTRDARALDTWLKATGLFEPPRRFRLYKVFVRRRDAPRVANPDALLQEALRWRYLSPLERRGATLSLGG